MLALPEVRNNLLEYQNLHPDGLHSLYVYEIASQGQRWDVPEVIYNQVESFGGVIRSDGVIGGVTGATSPHTNIALPAEHLRAYLSRTMLDGQQRDVIFPHEYENGKVNPNLVGSEATAPGHTMTLMWRESKNGCRETITTAEIGNMPMAEQDKYWEIWQECVLFQMNMYRDMYNDPEWRELNNIPPIDQLPTEKLLTDMTPTIHLVGYADRDQQQLTGLIRGAQSMSEWHASTLSMPYLHLPYEVKPVNAREVYKQVSPLDTCLFDVMKHMMEGVTEHDGYYVRSIGNVTRKLEEYPHMRPSYEGIEMFGVTSPDSMATVDIPFVVANRLMARDISRLSDIYQMGFRLFYAVLQLHG